MPSQITTHNPVAYPNVAIRIDQRARIIVFIAAHPERHQPGRTIGSTSGVPSGPSSFQNTDDLS